MREIAVVVGVAEDSLGEAIATTLSENMEVVGMDLVNPSDKVYDTVLADYFWLDLTSTESVRKAFHDLFQDYGTRPTVLVYAPGVNHMGEFRTYPEKHWDETMDVNLKGAFLCSQCFVDITWEGRHDRPRRIVHIGSNTSFIPRTRSVAYCVSKAGLNMLVRQSARELSPEGYRIMGINPGVIEDTSMHRKTHEELFDLRGWTEEKTVEMRLANIPIGRFSNRWEVSKVVKWMATSPEADYLTGSLLEYGGAEK